MVNLLGIRFSSVFQYPFFVSRFLRFCFFLKKYALFRPDVCQSISALSRLKRLHIYKDFVQHFCVYER